MPKKPSDESYTETETAERADAALKRMLHMPPKPHDEMKIGKRKASRGKSPGRVRQKSMEK